MTASVAQHEPDPYLAQVYRFGLLEDFDHLYRYSALDGPAARARTRNTILQSYTDIRPGRPDRRSSTARPRTTCARPYDRRRRRADHQAQRAHDHGRRAPDARLLHEHRAPCSPIRSRASSTPRSPRSRSSTSRSTSRSSTRARRWLEKWLLHEATEVYNYWSCVRVRRATRASRAIWERFLDYELGHLHFVMELFEQIERRDPAEVLPETLPEPIEYESHRDFVRDGRSTTRSICAPSAPRFVDGLSVPETEATLAYRQRVNANGSPSDTVAVGYVWQPGTELASQFEGRAK